MNDEEMIWERYKLISEVPASLEFMGDDPEITNKLEKEYKPVQKAKPSKRGIISKSIRSDINAWSNEKTRELMKSTVQNGTAKGLDKRRTAQGKPPLMWRLVDANLEKMGNFDWADVETSRIINRSDLENLINNNPQIKNKFSNKNGITVIMTPSGLDERTGMMSFSSWIRSHKCGHAILEYGENFEINNNIKKVLTDYYKIFKESLSIVKMPEYYNSDKFPILKSIILNKMDNEKHYNDTKNFYMDFFTFGSARNKQLLIQDMKEELVAQLMQTGKITLNKMIDDSMLENMKMWPEYNYFNIENILNIEEYIADQIDQAIENCIGEILYDVI